MLCPRRRSTRKTTVTTSTQWLPMSQLAEQLGCSERTIHLLKASGILQPGHHYYAATGSLRGKHHFHLERVRETLLKRTAEAVKARELKSPETYDHEHLRQLVEKKEISRKRK